MFKIFGKFWPDDSPLSPKLVANNRITIKYYTFVSDVGNISFVLLIYFKHNGTTSTKIKLFKATKFGLETRCRFVSFCRLLVVGLSYSNHLFHPSTIQVGFVVDAMSLGQVFSRVLQFSPVTSISPVLHTHKTI